VVQIVRDVRLAAADECPGLLFRLVVVAVVFDRYLEATA
jgi:hypothetical protein